MGLDMNLYKRLKSSNNEDDWEEVYYWRKANQIRDWFSRNLENFEDNGSTRVTKKDLESLLETCKDVLANHSLSKELLPTSSGFFFGGTDYDDWYYEDVEHTSNALEKILNTIDFDEYDVEYNEWY